MARQPRPTIQTPPSLGDPIEKVLDGYALAVGRVVRAWNQLQERLGQLFGVVLGTHHLLATAVWYSSDSDRTQQGMLREAIKASPADRWPDRPQAKADLLWLLKEANSLADSRNNAIHTPVAVWVGGARSNDPSKEFQRPAGAGPPFEIGPVAFRGNPRAGRLVGTRLLDELDWCEQLAVLLSRFSQHVEIALLGESLPWPDRPRLPTRGQKKTLQDPPLRPPRTRSRVRRRQSSPA